MATYRYTPPPAPWSCPHCLMGLCRSCPGELTVLTVSGDARVEPCGHDHPAHVLLVGARRRTGGRI